MCDHILIDPDKLYNIYSHKQVIFYYNYSFIPDFKSIEKEIFYDILNCLSLHQLNNLNKYIFKQWSLTKDTITKSEITLDKRKKYIVSLKYSSTDIHSSEEFNDKLNKFINNDKVMALFIINKLLLFLYPC